ncbi:MAG: sigma-70 family RNA polymerase sigma factor [Planctomycetes bacterium]|nr:sigma-70 family RNA polymerase sigma factor [Planctomycetota bacterium]
MAVHLWLPGLAAADFGSQQGLGVAALTQSVDNRAADRSPFVTMSAGEDNSYELGLISKARKGDANAYGELVEMHQNRIYASVVRVVRDEHRAFDIVQEAFVQAFRAIDTYEDRAKFSTWLYRIAMNLITSHHRHDSAQKRGGNQTRASLDVEGMPEPGADERDPGDMAAAGEIGVIVRAAIDELEDEYREVIVMRDLQDLSYEEIADMLKVPPGTVRSRLHRGREKLKDKLKHLL